jgi:PadR family transcriptional regulator PadR
MGPGDGARVLPYPESGAPMLPGTLELLVLKLLSVEPLHGWGITQRLEQMSRHVLQVNQGSLYPALERLKRSGWIKSEWRVTENSRRARYYYLTPAGKRRLALERSRWEQVTAATNLILDWTGGTA